MEPSQQTPFVTTNAMRSPASFHRVAAIGSPVCSATVIRSAHELRDENHAEPGIVVANAGVVVVAVRATAVPGVIDPGTAAHHAVRTHDRRPFLLHT